MVIVLGILSILSLAAAAGLNAFVPIVLLGVGAKISLVVLGWPLAGMPDAVLFGGFTSLLMVQFFVDKIPAWAGWNARIGMVLRPAAAAVAALAFGTPLGAFMWVAAAIAALVALGVSVWVARFRPVLGEISHGIGPPILSVTADLVAVVLTLTAALAPAVSLAFLGLSGYVFVKADRWVRARHAVWAANAAEPAVAVSAVPMVAAREPDGAVDGSDAEVRQQGAR